MLLTSTTLNESLGLLDMLPTGEFGLDVNTMKQKVVMHGDVLSCITHTNLKIAIAKKGTVPGNERLVNDLLGAHSRIDMQKGLFYQLIHQCTVVYTKYYGGFMQPLQVALGKKRVCNDPTKNFQDHNKHQMELYRAACCYRFVMFISSLTKEDLENDQRLGRKESLLSLESRMRIFSKEFETSDHEPSRMVALYLKDVASYKRCQDGMQENNYWILEMESCKWMGAWKQFKKNHYLALQSEYIELFYGEDFDPWLR